MKHPQCFKYRSSVKAGLIRVYGQREIIEPILMIFKRCICLVLVRHDGSAWKNAELFLSGGIIPIILDQVEGRDTL